MWNPKDLEYHLRPWEKFITIPSINQFNIWQVIHGGSFVHVFSAQINYVLIFFRVSDATTDSNKSYLQTIMSVLSWVSINFDNTTVTCSNPYSSSCTLLVSYYTAALIIFSHIIIPEFPSSASWIAHSLSGLKPITTYIGNPSLIHYPLMTY